MSGPEPAELRQPDIQLVKWSGFESVKTALCIHGGLHETGLAQHAQVFGHGRLRHAELAFDLSHRLLRRDQEAQYRAAVRLRNDFEYGFHFFYILKMEYTCQGIFNLLFCHLSIFWAYSNDPTPAWRKLNLSTRQSDFRSMSYG